ncbi:MAG: LD-carboxypeptidase [Ignavibacteriae bacterium]|nr:LD-carboxypeptidase [Ignavibacteriota bacterium]NOG97485.1 LD-carboxypeptidase [Ignavibacteriota bacterium]
MKLQKPKKLSKGDLIGIISPASNPDDLSKIDKGVQYLEKLGYNVEVGKNVGQRRGYLAGDDKQRLDDLHSMFKNKQVKAIINVRGGYGSGRLLDKIDFNLIKRNPKIFVGYSDITALQMAMLKKAGLVTFAGPMLAVDFYGKINSYTEENFWKLLTASKKIGKLHNPENESFYVLNKGRAEGSLVGGNLALITSLMGTDYQPNFKNTILMLEEIGEVPYRIDRMFNQLKLGKVFNQVNGIILGRFVDCYEEDSDKETLTLNEIIEDYLAELKLPIIYNFKHGHVKQNMTVPFGLNCKLNSSRKFVEITESAVI